MITINFLRDENGYEQVADFIDDLGAKALDDEVENSHAYAEMASRIYFVLDYMRDIGVPPEHLRTLTTKSLEGYNITLSTIVKELKGHPPLLEFRISTKELGAFRAIFFYINDDDGNQHIYFTKAVIKKQKESQEFENSVVESKRMLEKFWAEN